MYLRIYTVNQKYVKNRNGDIGVYKKKIKKWIRSNKPYKPQKRGPEKRSIFSERFGFLEQYNRKEQQGLICPSGYSISQCFNVLRKMWYGYHKARSNEKSRRGMVKYAKAIQNVQKDMGIKTTSFPHLGMYGDVFILNDKHGNRIVCEDQSQLMKKQERYEKRQAENAKKIMEFLQKPDKDKGEEIVTFVDDVSPYVKQANEQTVPNLLEPDVEKGEEILTIPDNIPFRPHRRRRLSRLTISDDVYPHEMIESDTEQTVPHFVEL
jgi:hypothetical protein